MKQIPNVLVFVSVLVLSSSGCQKKEARVDATQPLAQSFDAAQPEVKQAIQTVNANLKSGNYTEALKSLTPVVEGGKLTEPQKQAAVTALQQINQALAANPALDTKELYEQRLKLIKAVRGF